MAKKPNKVAEEQHKTEEAVAAAPAPEKTTKSIVNPKYAGRYKKGGSDALAEFINEQCNDDKGNFSFAKFFELCRANDLGEKEGVDMFEQQVEEKRHGAPGRARMTLRNRLAGIARRNKKLIDLE